MIWVSRVFEVLPTMYLLREAFKCFLGFSCILTILVSKIYLPKLYCKNTFKRALNDANNQTTNLDRLCIPLAIV